MFRDWKADPVTKAVFDAVINNIQNIQVELGDTAGQEPLYDRFRAGYIAGCKDVLNTDAAEVLNDN